MPQSSHQALNLAMNEGNLQAMHQGNRQAMPQTMTQAMPQSSLQAMGRPNFQAMPQPMPQAMMQGMPQASVHATSQGLPSSYSGMSQGMPSATPAGMHTLGNMPGSGSPGVPSGYLPQQAAYQHGAPLSSAVVGGHQQPHQQPLQPQVFAAPPRQVPQGPAPHSQPAKTE
mmetsp:Transcript_14706/g.34672  ORF Transcript_14706/g.34672 Transcript_14706/m.34672 type:complete len:170 (-) Transcript_14706:315-824(-)